MTEHVSRSVELKRGKIAIKTLYRVGRPQRAGTIVVLDRGTIVEVGSHEEPMSNKGLYHRLFSLQAQWYVA